MSCNKCAVRKVALSLTVRLWAGWSALAGRGVYHATKHGVLGLTKSAALEYAARGIQINAVCPGIIRTPMVENMLNSEPDAMAELMKLQPIGRLGEPEEIARAVLWLCSSMPVSSPDRLWQLMAVIRFSNQMSFWFIPDRV